MLTESADVLTTPVPPLRATRVSRGLSLRAVAASAEIDPAHLSRVERGEKSLSVDALHRVAVVLGLTELAEQLEPYRATKDGTDG